MFGSFVRMALYGDVMIMKETFTPIIILPRKMLLNW